MDNKTKKTHIDIGDPGTIKIGSIKKLRLTKSIMKTRISGLLHLSIGGHPLVL